MKWYKLSHMYQIHSELIQAGGKILCFKSTNVNILCRIRIVTVMERVHYCTYV